MAYYKTCLYCGAHLDPEETCDDCRMTTEKDAHPPIKHCERLYNQQPPKRTASPILYDRRFSVKLSGKF